MKTTAKFIIIALLIVLLSGVALAGCDKVDKNSIEYIFDIDRFVGDYDLKKNEISRLKVEGYMIKDLGCEFDIRSLAAVSEEGCFISPYSDSYKLEYVPCDIDNVLAQQIQQHINILQEGMIVTKDYVEFKANKERIAISSYEHYLEAGYEVNGLGGIYLNLGAVADVEFRTSEIYYYGDVRSEDRILMEILIHSSIKDSNGRAYPYLIQFHMYKI